VNGRGLRAFLDDHPWGALVASVLLVLLMRLMVEALKH